jgi:dephospho-CoA kinase
MQHRPLIIGITGGIGSGKSTLSDLLRTEGYKVYDSDTEARRLQNVHPKLVKQIKKLLGDNVYDSNGLNRSKVAGIVFSQKELLQKLSKIVHPVIKQDFFEWINKNSVEKFLFMESAILFESGFYLLTDKVIVMTASESVRIARVVKRDGVHSEHVKARMMHQLPEEVKIAKADFVIYSDDNEPLLPKIHSIIEKLECRY